MLIFFSIISNTGVFLYGNDSISLNGYEKQLQQKFTELVSVLSNERREEVNDRITSLLVEALDFPGSFEYPFDSLAYMGKVMSPDSLLSIYSWNVPMAGEGNLYSGILQFRDTTDLTHNIIVLEHQKSGYDEGIETGELNASTWYGALYYQIVPVERDGSTAYTLIGLDHNDYYTNRKVIDLMIPRNGDVTFGAPVFRISGDLRNRVVFEYSSRVVMHLRYHEEFGKIVCDHLSPPDERYRGQYRYYGPDFSYDGFIFEDGEWMHLTDIDVMIREKPEVPEIK